MSKDIIQMEQQMGLSSQRRMQTLAINDLTSENDSFTGNVLGMCCTHSVLPQQELIDRTIEAHTMLK